MLPERSKMSRASHGYIVYPYQSKHQPKVEDVIRNTASIYFDYNAPVQTNTEKTRVTGDVVLPLRLLSFTAGHSGNVNTCMGYCTEINTDRFDIQRSGNGREFASIATIKTYNNGKTENEYHYTDLSPWNKAIITGSNWWTKMVSPVTALFAGCVTMAQCCYCIKPGKDMLRMVCRQRAKSWKRKSWIWMVS